MKKDKHPALNSAILEETQAYATSLLTEKLPNTLVFHTLKHTQKVVKTAQKIGIKSELNDLKLEMLLMAAWLHDIGYCFDVLNHVQESMKAAKTYLLGKDYPMEQIEYIVSCIAATKVPQNPKNLTEKILCDADLAHLASKAFEAKTELLRKETSLLEGKEISRKDWLFENIKFLQSHRFFTSYGRNKLWVRQEENYKKTMEQLKALIKEAKLENKLLKADEKSYEKEEKQPFRGIETMFRTTSHNHLELGAIADNKANIMITINSISISLIISILFSKFEEFPNLIIPTAILTLVCLLSIVIAILATRPVITTGKFSREDMLDKQTNLLFFGNFHKMPLEEYEWGMKEIMKDSDLLYGNLIHDIYNLGRVLGRKYYLLRICYSIFMYGIILSILAYGIAFIFFPVS